MTARFNAFTGKIPVSGLTSIETSAFATTEWPNDAATLPAHNPAAWAETAWSSDDDNAQPRATAGLLITSDW